MCEFKKWKMLSLVVGFCWAGSINPIGVVAGVRRQSVALSTRPNWVGST
jgi:hypothetical protein